MQEALVSFIDLYIVDAADVRQIQVGENDVKISFADVSKALGWGYVR